MPHKNAEPVSPRFQPEDKVRVKSGVRIPDGPDIPLGGWVGTTQEVERW